MSFLDIFKRKKVDTSKRSYEGASKGKRLSAWFTGAGDANAQIDASLPGLRERSRDLRRNNPYAHKGVELITNNVVGKGINTQLSGPNSDIITKHWKSWAESTACDFDGRHTLKGLQRVAFDAIVESGEVLIRRRIISSAAYPVQYQILESDFLDTTSRSKPSKKENYIMQGIEFSKLGKIVGYHLFESHPGSSRKMVSSGLKSNFIPADEIRHLFRQERPGQCRGVPWLAPVMIRMKDLDGFEDAQLLRQKIAACFTVFVHDISAEDCGPETEEELGARVEPGMIEHLPPGKTVTFADPPSVQNYKEFTSSQLRGISAGLGVSYEALTGDLTEVNFSSARMGWIEMNRNIESWRSHILINGFINPAWSDFIWMLFLMGINASNVTAEHVPPKREMIDPTKEIPAAINAIRGGLSSRSAQIASMGGDIEEVDAQIKKDNDNSDKNNIILDTDPRYIDGSGRFQIVPGESSEQNQDT